MSDILSHVDGGVMTLTFNRLDKKNSITESMYKALADGIEQAQNDSAVRVLVFQGHETVFCAGNDIADFLHNPPFSPTSPILRLLHNAASFTKPMLASVAGPAVGIGTTLLFHCDLVYAGDNAAFAMPFVNLGVCPEAGSSLLAPQLMGYLHGRSCVGNRLGQPRVATDRSQQLHPNPSAQAGRQALDVADGDQAFDESGASQACDGSNGR
jgi:enoyl-CoA hydratase/carnithine racemase